MTCFVHRRFAIKKTIVSFFFIFCIVWNLLFDSILFWPILYATVLLSRKLLSVLLHFVWFQTCYLIVFYVDIHMNWIIYPLLMIFGFRLFCHFNKWQFQILTLRYVVLSGKNRAPVLPTSIANLCQSQITIIADNSICGGIRFLSYSNVTLSF